MSMRSIEVRVMILVLSLSGALRGLAKGNPESTTEFHNEYGWVWHTNPTRSGWTQRTAEGGMVMRMDTLKGDRLLLTFAYPAALGRDVVRFRPVAFDASGHRFEFRIDGTSGTRDVVQEGHTLELVKVSAEGIKFLGIEKLTKQNLETVVAPAAFRKLKEAGATVLPYPVIGKRYEFELSTIDGKKLSSQDLRGKVVLLDFWAKWCLPCMAKMPKLKETFARLHERGFEVIGINHDYSADAAKATISKEGIPWPNVLAPLEKSQRELWEEATGTFGIPRLLLIDREGFLRVDASPYDLEAQIEKLVNK